MKKLFTHIPVKFVYRPICFACGSKNVEWSQEFDHFCSSQPTTACVCKDCGADWYDDTAPTAHEPESNQPILGEG